MLQFSKQKASSCVSLSTRECSRSRSEMRETMTCAFMMFSRAERSVQQRSPGSAETLRYIVARTRNRNDILYKDDVNIDTLMFVDRFKCWIDCLDNWCFRKMKFFALATPCNTIALRYRRAISTFDLNFTRFVNVITDAQHIHSIIKYYYFGDIFSIHK